MNEFTKQPAETYTIGVEFLGKLPSGASLSGGSVNAFDPAGADVSSSVLSSTNVTIAGTQAQVRVLAGHHGTDYRLRLRVTLSNSDVLEEDVVMHVENQ